MLVRVERHPNGLRVHMGRWRWHHYHSGVALIAVGARLIWRDRADFPKRRPSVVATVDPVIGVTTSHNRGVW